ncbi:acyltransferase family protein [[Eubacterium] cellulosolvens]
MNDKEQGTIKGNRIYFLDNLRTFMIFLVVLYHAGLVYASSGVGAYINWIVIDPATNDMPDLVNLIVDIFIMANLFFISGYFTPLSLKTRKDWIFLKDRFKRLMIPWVIAVLTLIPLYKIIFLYSRNLPQEHWTTYFHFNQLTSQNWLWFLPVLFLFNILYLLFSRVNIFTFNISLKRAVFSVFLIGFVYSFFMDIFNGVGWTLTVLIDFQNERFLIYFMIFLLGSLCYKLNIFESKGTNKKLYYVIIFTIWIPIIVYIFFYVIYLLYPDYFIFSSIIDSLLLWFSFNLSLLCLLYVMINTFRYYLNKQGRIGKELNKNSYYVYIIHVIVLAVIALIMLNVAIPSLLKYLVLTISTFVTSNLIISLVRALWKSRNYSDRSTTVEEMKGTLSK